MKIDEFGGTKKHRVATPIEDTPLKFKLKTRRVERKIARYGWQGSAQLYIVTTSNSIAGLRNATSPDTLSRDLSAPTVGTSSSKLRQSSSGGTASYQVDLQFTAIRSSRADSMNLRGGVCSVIRFQYYGGGFFGR